MRYAKMCVFFLFLLAAATASAGYLDIYIDAFCYPPYSSCGFQPYVNGPGSPAAGYAKFPVMTSSGNLWSFTFQTANPYSWGYDMYHFYYANFGTGGTFQMTGPGDLTLLGEITSGSVFGINGEAEGAIFNFAGEWSNSLDASGQLTLREGDFREATLEVATGVPEPTCIALLGSTMAGLCGARRRLRI